MAMWSKLLLRKWGLKSEKCFSSWKKLISVTAFKQDPALSLLFHRWISLFVSFSKNRCYSKYGIYSFFFSLFDLGSGKWAWKRARLINSLHMLKRFGRHIGRATTKEEKTWKSFYMLSWSFKIILTLTYKSFESQHFFKICQHWGKKHKQSVTIDAPRWLSSIHQLRANPAEPDL